MSQWKLVEAEAVDKNNNQQQQHHHHKQFNNNNYDNRNYGQNSNKKYGNNRRNSNGKDNKNRNYRGGNRRQQQDIYVANTVENRQQYAAMAVQLLEYYFSDDSLSCDTFVRSYLDTEGYIPIGFVCNFPDIVAIGAYYEDIIAQLRQSERFEIDEENETIRVKGWEKWLMPNGEGGFGVPRYVKSMLEEQQYTGPDVNANPEETRDRSGSKELSVNASEFVFNVPSSK